MNRQIISIGTAGILVGFILGFFTARSLVQPPPEEIAAAEESLPENHPGLETMENVREMTAAAEAEAGNVQVRVELGNTFYDMGRYDVASRWYREALDLDPDQPRVSTDLGTSLLFMGRTSEAIDQYRHSLSVQPGHPQSMQNLGVALFSLEQYREAIKIWEKLLEVNPGYDDAAKIREQIESARERLDSLEGENR